MYSARAHVHISRARAGLRASSEAWGVWRVFGGINGLQMSGTRWREGSNRSVSLIFSSARSLSLPRSPSLCRARGRRSIHSCSFQIQCSAIFPHLPIDMVNLHLLITDHYLPAPTRLCQISAFNELFATFSGLLQRVRACDLSRLINEEQMRTINAHVLHTRPCQSLA